MTKIQNPISKAPNQQHHVDLNHDGLADILPKVNPAESLENHVPPDKYFADFGGLKTPGGLIRFGLAPPEIRLRSGTRGVVVCTDPSARFYIPKTMLSFTPGQKVQAVNDQGRLDETFVMKGIAMEFKEGSINFNLHAEVLPNPKYFGYGTYKGRIIEVPLDHLRWVVGKNDILDPARLSAKEAPRSIAESLLQPLFQVVAKLPQQFPGDNQRAKRLEQFNKLIESWETSALTIDPNRTEDIMTDPVWTGIEHALSELADLTPADFPR